ncbi:hypothetical protein, partial [Bacillus mycoides]|uniref:hypothetical protein n=1 Tax=Bacillus mycoides TaxID=1405 RepID=UPI003A801CDC
VKVTRHGNTISGLYVDDVEATNLVGLGVGFMVDLHVTDAYNYKDSRTVVVGTFYEDGKEFTCKEGLHIEYYGDKRNCEGEALRKLHVGKVIRVEGETGDLHLLVRDWWGNVFSIRKDRVVKADVRT